MNGAVSDIYANLAQSVTLVIRHWCCSPHGRNHAQEGYYDMRIKGLSIFGLLIMVLTLAFLTAGIPNHKGESFFKWFLAGASLGIVALLIAIFKRKQTALPAQKRCPKCGKQLPIQALVCDACDYNFLSMMVGCQHKPVPPPSEQTAQLSTQPKNPVVQRASNHFAH